MGEIVRWVNERRVWTGVVLVVLGGITSVVVAMGVAVLGPASLPARGASVPVDFPSPIGGTQLMGIRDRDFGRVHGASGSD